MPKFLYDHQQKIVDENPLKCGLWLGTGSGKTRTALCLSRGDILVIAPKTQVEDENWLREYKEVLLHRIKDKSTPPVLKPRLTVISKETFRRDWVGLPRFNTIIVDEAHTMLGVTPNTRQRNRVPIPKTSQLYEALEAYLAKHKPDRLYLATATIIKSPMTVWGAGKILGRVDVVGDFYKFRDRFYTRLNMPGREVYSPRSDGATKDLLATMVKKLGYVGRLEDYFDVPEQTYITKYIELTAAQRALISNLRLEYPDPLVLIGKKHQVENGVLAGDEFNESCSLSNGKIDKILELAEEFPRMIVFCKFRAQIDAIEGAVHKAGHRTFVLHGDIQDRGGLLHAAQNSKEYVFICQAQMSAGWQLPECPVMVFASMTYSLVDRVQAEGRILRANNLKKNLYIDLVVKGGIDEAVQKSIKNKQDFDERLYINV